MPAYLGVDIGGTRTSAGLVGADGALIALERQPTDRAAGAAATLAVVERLARKLVAAARADGVAVAGVGVGFGGPVDYARGVVRLSHHAPGWEQLPLRDRLRAALELPVAVDNDCNAAALGEWRFGAGRGADDILYVNIGTGIGAGVIAGGKLLRGANNAAGELGHMVLDRAGPPCACGKRGCLEALCAGPAIALRARSALGDAAMTAERAFTTAAAGDAAARALLAAVAEDLAHAVGNALVVLGSVRVILGGGVGSHGALLLEPLRAALPRYVLAMHLEGLEVVTAQRGYDAGVLGAAALAMEEIG